MNPKLRIAMSGNLIFSSLSAFAFLLFTKHIAIASGLSELILRLVAIALLGFVGILWYGIQSKQILVAKLAVILDTLWVVSSLIVVLGGWLALTPSGVIGVTGIAVIVAGFAIWQFLSIEE
jgi:hypothetical protein